MNIFHYTDAKVTLARNFQKFMEQRLKATGQPITRDFDEEELKEWEKNFNSGKHDSVTL